METNKYISTEKLFAYVLLENQTVFENFVNF